MPNKVYHRSDPSEDGGTRLTPKWIIDLAIQTMGKIDLDPCSEIPGAGQPYNVPAARHFTIEHNGLMRTWRDRVFMNPPYGKHRMVDLWIDKLLAEFYAGHITQAIALLPARVGTSWWAKLRDFPVCFISGRVSFVGFSTGAGFPSSVHYIGDRLADFYRVWSPSGNVYMRVDSPLLFQTLHKMELMDG